MVNKYLFYIDLFMNAVTKQPELFEDTYAKLGTSAKYTWTAFCL